MPLGGVRSRHVSRGHRRGRESSAGRLAHPPHSMRVVEACSAAAARGASFARPQCRSYITEVHSAAALNGYDGTAPFHHTAYAASYTARSATLQATPQATPWRRFNKTGHGYAGRKIPTGKARKSRIKIFPRRSTIIALGPFVLNTTSLGPPVGDSTAMYAPPLRYKREALVAHGRLSRLSEDSLDTPKTQARIHSEQFRSQPLESTSNTTHSGLRVLRSGGPNHSKPAVFIMFLHLDSTNPS